MEQLKNDYDHLRTERDSLMQHVEELQREQSRGYGSRFGVIGGERRTSSNNNLHGEKNFYSPSGEDDL